MSEATAETRSDLRRRLATAKLVGNSVVLAQADAAAVLAAWDEDMDDLQLTADTLLEAWRLVEQAMTMCEMLADETDSEALSVATASSLNPNALLGLPPPLVGDSAELTCYAPRSDP
jgi:hypothetical protein